MQRKVLHKKHLQKLYNQNTVVQDSQRTSFAYLKTLAFQLAMVIFTIISMAIVLLNYFYPNAVVAHDKMDMVVTAFTLLSIIALIFQKMSIMLWIKQKKDYQASLAKEIVFTLIEIILLIPSPSPFLADQISLTVKQFTGYTVTFVIQDLLGAYLMLRAVYLLKFVIHAELYYGSRADRLSRLYTVKFGTFNAFKFLINEKPQVILMVIFVLNYLFLPLVLLLVQGKINPKLSNFIACMYYQVVTQVTVGYGDIVVISLLGRALMVISIIIGITTTSVLLIFFMRLMQQDSSEEQAHNLLSVLERKQEISKSLVERVQTQVSYLGKKVPSQKRQEFKDRLQEFKFKNARKIRYQKEVKPNLKRMMVSNFSALVESLNELKETEIMLAKYIKIIENSTAIKKEEQASKESI